MALFLHRTESRRRQVSLHLSTGHVSDAGDDAPCDRAASTYGPEVIWVSVSYGRHDNSAYGGLSRSNIINQKYLAPSTAGKFWVDYVEIE